MNKFIFFKKNFVQGEGRHLGSGRVVGEKMARGGIKE